MQNTSSPENRMSHSRTLSEQLQHLSDKGLHIADESMVLHHLGRVNYHRLKGYWTDLLDSSAIRCFREGVEFEDIIVRYKLDKALRSMLFSALETIEVALRTKMIYHLSYKFGCMFYEKAELFDNPVFHRKHLIDLRGEFMRSNEGLVKHYKRKYGIWKDNQCMTLSQSPPSWVIFELASFGTLSKLYKNLQHQLPEKSLIANEFGLNSHSELASWLEALVYLRNLVAHHARLWGRKIVKQPKILQKTKNPWLKSTLNEQASCKPYLLISILAYLCQALGDEDGFTKQVLELMKSQKELPITELGFVQDWEKEELWRTNNDG